MATVVADVVLLLPDAAAARSVALSHELALAMTKIGNPSHFRLGEGIPSAEYYGICEPHVSLFMLQIDADEMADVTAVVGALAGHVAPIPVAGLEYRHNLYGAPEIHYRKTPRWAALQRAVVASVEPLRRGRLRERDPGGEWLSDVIENSAPGAVDRIRQLRAYGYDEIVDELSDRFNPHVTLAWPERPAPAVELNGLPPVAVFDDVLTKLAVYGMSQWGTCTRRYGVFDLTAEATAAPYTAGPEVPRPQPRSPTVIETDPHLSGQVRVC
jgi:hypothetical protein